jgi:hypothetical protein
LLVILDQFEELSLYQSGQNGAGSFDAELPRLVNDRRLAVNFLISIREDSLAQLDRFRHSIPGLFENRLRVPPLSEAGAKEAIIRPIQRYNELVAPAPEVAIEDELVAAVLDQVRTGRVMFDVEGHGGLAAGNGHNQGQASGNIETPYLQLVMERVWERETASGSHVLRRSTLAELGESQEIVRTHLDKALGDLSAEQREAAVDVFDHLVTPSGTKIALRLPDLVVYSQRPPDQVEALVETLSSGPRRILRPVPPPPGTEGKPGVEIFHDVLAPAILAWRTRQSAERLEREKREADERARRERRLGAGPDSSGPGARKDPGHGGLPARPKRGSQRGRAEPERTDARVRQCRRHDRVMGPGNRATFADAARSCRRGQRGGLRSRGRHRCLREQRPHRGTVGCRHRPPLARPARSCRHCVDRCV